MRCPGASGARTFTCVVGPEATAPSGRANRRLCTSSVSLEASAATSTSRLSSVHWLRNSLRRSAQIPHDSGHSSRTAIPSKRGSGSTSQIESKRARTGKVGRRSPMVLGSRPRRKATGRHRRREALPVLTLTLGDDATKTAPTMAVATAVVHLDAQLQAVALAAP